MNISEQSPNGSTQHLTLDEIAQLTRMARGKAGMKQMNLANAAKVSEKTIERIEKGVRVTKDTYERVAIALGLAKDIFVAAHYIPTSHELDKMLAAAREQFEQNHTRLVARRVAGSRDVRELLQCMAYLVDDSCVAEADLERCAALRSNLADYGDIHADLDATQQLDAERAVLEFIRSAEGTTYSAYCCTRRMIMKHNEAGTFRWQIAVLKLFPREKAEPPAREVWIEKQMQMAF